MFCSLARIVISTLFLLPVVAAAEPITLKLAFFSSDRTHLYRSGAKPFVDAVNSEGRGRVKIEVYFSGQLGKDLSQQSQLLDEAADIAYVIPPYEPLSFPDSAVIELPGLYKDAAQATAVFSRLVASGTIRDFKDYFVIGAFAGEPESIHTRSPVASLADLKDKRIRANNSTEIDIFKKLSISPVFVPLNETAQIISGGKVDGAAAPPVPTIEFGIGRVAPNHYFLRTSCIPQVLLMTRKRFGSLPGDIQSVISKYSGTWFADHYTRINETSTALVMNQLESDPKRKVVFPSPADTEKVKAIFNSIVDDYAARNPHNAELVKAARAIISKVNSSTEVPQ